MKTFILEPTGDRWRITVATIAVFLSSPRTPEIETSPYQHAVAVSVFTEGDFPLIVFGIVMHPHAGTGTLGMWRGSSHPLSPSVFPTQEWWISADLGRQTAYPASPDRLWPPCVGQSR